MTEIEFPPQLEALLKGSPLQPRIRAFANRVGECLQGSNLTFFPDYTDHGARHITDVLSTQEDLVPDEVWTKKLLTDADAAVIIGGTLLHDLAMHLTEAGFRELVAPGTRFQPLPWFDQDHEGHHADRPWPELWDDYLREVKRFSDRKLVQILGERSASEESWSHDGDLKLDKLRQPAGDWSKNLRLIVGEFIRRHHPRLAHEIAIYGFPGLAPGSGVHQFPALGSGHHELHDQADLIGIVARSHGMSLRTALAALVHCYGDNSPRPMNCAALYAMALLRVGDYLQLDKSRTPAVLLQLKDPQSPISIQEWNKHLAVRALEKCKNPAARFARVDRHVKWETFLQLEELLKGVQQEMDHSTAVLGQEYGGHRDLECLQLKIRHIESNLHDPHFRKQLDYVPERTGFSSDPNLLSLLVEPLYGFHPGVGVRELMQNSVDAVRELNAWCENHGKKPELLDLPDLDEEADVLIDFIVRGDGTWLLRIQDRGIGMTPEILRDYFLRAGASFRQSGEWSKEYVGEDGIPRVQRSGRFGVGVFAAFLLGPSLRVWTRHAGGDDGYELEAREDSQQIEIKRSPGLAIGTRIEVELSEKVRDAFSEEIVRGHIELEFKTDWFVHSLPHVVRRVGPENRLKVIHPQYRFAPAPAEPEWFSVETQGLDSVHWTFDDAHSLSCNGIVIRDASLRASLSSDRLERNGLRTPNVAVMDSRAALPLTVQRYALSFWSQPLERDLLGDVLHSLIAYSLINGPASCRAARGADDLFPLAIANNPAGHSRELPSFAQDCGWCASQAAFVPWDPWLSSLVEARSLLFFGFVERGRSLRMMSDFPEFLEDESLLNCQMKSWSLNLPSHASLDKVVKCLEAPLPGYLAPGCRFRLILLGWGELNVRHRSMKRVEHSVGAVGLQQFEHENSSPELENSQVVSNGLAQLVTRGSSAHFRNSSEVEVYVGEWDLSGSGCVPESPLALIWQDCLGANPIPFDSLKRNKLIERGRAHPALRRHIEAWEAFKQTNRTIRKRTFW